MPRWRGRPPASRSCNIAPCQLKPRRGQSRTFLIRLLHQSLQRGQLKRRNRQKTPLHRRTLHQTHTQLLRSLRSHQPQPLQDRKPQPDPHNLLGILKPRRRPLNRDRLHRNQLQSRHHIQLRLHTPKSHHQNTILRIRIRWQSQASQL